jgi:type I restriction enzyme S subunit
MSVEIDWMGGRTPSTWKIFKLKHVLREEQKEIGRDLPAGSISFGEVVFKNFENDETLATYRTVRRGQFLINPLNLNYDLKSLRIGLSEIDCRVSPAYIVASNRERISRANYLRWALRVFDVQHIKTLGAGVRQTVKFEDIGGCRIALPSVDHQEAIANNLDRATSRIDALVSKKTRFIGLLHEKRMALITHAVSKGLDATVPMKDSGVEWLGEMPAHWMVPALKRLVSTPITDGPHETPAKRNVGVRFISAEAVSSGAIDFRKAWGLISGEDNAQFSRKYKPATNDIYMIKSGATTGVVAIVEEDIDFNIWSPLAAIRPNHKVIPRFLLHALRSAEFQAGVALNWSYGTQQNIGMKVLGGLSVPFPPIDEQQQIVSHLDRATSRIDTLISKTERSIELLREHRTALITAAVTGKIDLCEAA